MPTKQTKEFGEAEKNQVFSLQNGANPLQEESNFGEKEIILNIAQAKENAIVLKRRSWHFELTGNPLLDSFKKINDYLIDHTRINIREKATFFRLLSVMLNSGLPLIKSLRTLALQAEKTPKLKKILLAMALAIETGKSLSEAMGQFPEVFNEAQIGMVRAGEVSGQLNKTLKDLAEEVEKTASITGKIKGALVYPIAILILLTIVIFVMMVAVIPQLTKLFTETGRELPLPTRILIIMSDIAVHYWPVMLFGLLTLAGGLLAWRKTKSGHYFLDWLMLGIPIFGPVIQKGILSKFARSFSNLLTSGVPIIKSLEIVANAIGNDVYKQRLYLTAEDMKRGIPMAENLIESKLFPTMLVNMIEIGEQTAQLETVTLKVAEFYDEEVNNVVQSLTKIMEPLILVIIGVTVGGLVAAIMLPIIQLTNFTGGFL